MTEKREAQRLAQLLLNVTTRLTPLAQISNDYLLSVIPSGEEAVAGHRDRRQKTQ